jgi:hypothetical protein
MTSDRFCSADLALLVSVTESIATDDKQNRKLKIPE